MPKRQEMVHHHLQLVHEPLLLVCVVSWCFFVQGTMLLVCVVTLVLVCGTRHAEWAWLLGKKMPDQGRAFDSLLLASCKTH